MKFSAKIDQKQAKEVVTGLVKAQGPVTTKKVAMMIIIVATENLVRSYGSDRTGLSRRSGSGQYAHRATGKTIRSFKATAENDGWRIEFGGASSALEYGRGPHTVPIADLRTWAAAKFPGLQGQERDRFIYNIQRRIKRNGLRPTRFLSRAVREVSSEMRRVKYMQALPSEAQLQAYANSVRQRVETAMLPRAPRRNG